MLVKNEAKKRRVHKGLISPTAKSVYGSFIPWVSLLLSAKYTTRDV